MYVEAVELLNPFVKRFKIREYDSRNLLENKTSDLINEIFNDINTSKIDFVTAVNEFSEDDFAENAASEVAEIAAERVLGANVFGFNIVRANLAPLLALAKPRRERSLLRRRLE